MPTSTTSSSAPKLSDLAKHVVAPAGIVSTGWPSVRAKCAEMGIRFRPWQPDVGRLILAKRADGKYASTIGGTGLSIPRQVGKTFLVAAIVFALCLLRPGLTVIWTAHRLRTAEETFGKLQVFARRRKIWPHVAKIILGSGEEEIRFANGSRILFGARERGFGRGFDEVDVLIYDEAQILGESALDDMVPATNQSRQETGALLLFMGTPPKPEDKAEVFTRMRTEALSGEDTDTGWVEFGADDGFQPTPLPAQLTAADWQQIEKANPSFPAETPREAILRMRKKLGADSFQREGLGIWDAQGGAVPITTWKARGRPGATGTGIPSLAVSVSRDRIKAFLLGATQTEDGKVLVEVVAGGTNGDWFVPKIIEIAKRQGAEVAVAPGHPAGALIPRIEDAGVRVAPFTGQQYTQACGAFYDAVIDGTIAYPDPQPELTDAVTRATRKTSGDAWRWDGEDITALVAATQAFALAAKERRTFWGAYA